MQLRNLQIIYTVKKYRDVSIEVSIHFDKV